ncbi:hypothetical protein PK28_11915 [Hymenobacter sp. DG25B]|uniref:hypothetical protein n=1 Tax=Hymenobacter sp. DG25B TaxID=1385664 RepID=UPI00054104DB|nr:hypothetical protein [Hymenobacter sp. DG25B]AIZ64215.1 hypothetical protein PK28_11915 [Hymenobacter sp. DG25B]
MDRKLVAVVEVKPKGTSLTAVAEQLARYLTSSTKFVQLAADHLNLQNSSRCQCKTAIFGLLKRDKYSAVLNFNRLLVLPFAIRYSWSFRFQRSGKSALRMMVQRYAK